jgi:hypothetical protein
MPDPTGGLLTAALVVGTGVASASSQKSAANTAARAQTANANLAIDEQRQAREQMRALLQPYVDAGNPALQGILGLTGLAGPDSQQAAFAQQEASPLFQGIARQGENAILQNASATGGLRGGNVQGALGQFRPALLNQFIEQQYGRMAGIANLGQNAAAGVGQAGMNTANQIGTQFGNIGAAQAGQALARGQANANMFGLPLQALGMMGGMGGGGMFGGGVGSMF